MNLYGLRAPRSRAKAYIDGYFKVLMRLASSPGSQAAHDQKRTRTAEELRLRNRRRRVRQGRLRHV